MSFLETFRKFKKILWNFTIILAHLYQRMPLTLNISPAVWQSYINAILDCFQSRNYCEAIIDDLLLFTPTKRAHMVKLEDILKALLKNGLKVSSNTFQLFRKEL